MKRRFASSSALLVSALAALAVVPSMAATPAATVASLQCPPGYEPVDAAEVLAERALPNWNGRERTFGLADMLDPTCRSLKMPEPPAELMAMRNAPAASIIAPNGLIPRDALVTAMEQVTAMAAAADDVAGTGGTWAPYGVGELIGDSPDYPEVLAQGFTGLAGRVDDLVWIEGTERVFAAAGTSGVWVSDDLGLTWRSIADTLPAVAVSALDWTDAEGGRLLVLTGEHTFGGGSAVGNGVWWTDDLGGTWTQAAGVPDSAQGFALEVDPTNESIAYAATGFGLFRTTDAGATWLNTDLPTSPECTGVVGRGTACQLATVVTDVIVKVPGGASDAEGGEVLAAVGYRAGSADTWNDGTVRSPRNGLYRSATGEPGSFEYLDVAGDGLTPVGFATAERAARIELGQATGPDQDHDIVYAIVGDALLFTGGTPYIDVPGDVNQTVGNPFDPISGLTEEVAGIPVMPNTVLNGVYVSTDFGGSWTRMADDVEIAENPLNGSTLAPIRALIAPGIQGWYNLFIEPDPTSTLLGAPTRMVFGLEEVFANRVDGVPLDGVAQAAGPFDFNVIGRYFGGDRCLFLEDSLGIPTLPACPTADPVTFTTTTHPDQHSALWIPREDGGVTLLVGNDGGVFRADLAAGEVLDNASWSDSSTGMYSLLQYSLAVAKDGTVYSGLQDNGTMKIDPEAGNQIFMSYVGDGTFVATDPDDSNVVYAATPRGAFVVSTNGGQTYDFFATGDDSGDLFQFINPFALDPTDGDHFLTAGTRVYELTGGETEAVETGLTQVFDLGTNANQPEARNLVSSLDVHGDAAYVAYCGVCDIFTSAPLQFFNGIATNVGGDAPGARGTTAGWHHATAAGLPNRFITSIEIDPDDPETIYVTLGGYSGRQWAAVGSYDDDNPNLGGGHVYRSTDAGETFTDITGNLPDMRHNTIVRRGDQLLVGTDLGVFVSADLDGSTWAPLSGLPTVQVTQLQVHPGDEQVLFASTFGRGAWAYTFPAAAPEPAPTDPSTGENGGGIPLPATGAGLVLPALALLGLAGAGMRERRRVR